MYFSNYVIFSKIFKDNSGRTALHLAATSYPFLRLRRQIENSRHQVDENELFKQKEMELAQVQSRSSKCCEILINHGASVDIKDNNVSFI